LCCQQLVSATGSLAEQLFQQQRRHSPTPNRSDPPQSLSLSLSSLFLGYYYAADRKKGKGSPYSITERRVPELIPVLGSQPAGDVSHKPCGKLPLLSARPAVTPATLKRAATNIAAW